MLHLDQMFPKKTLDAEDFFAFAGEAGAVLTIEKLDYKTLASRNFGEPELVYYLFVREFKKPFKLNSFNAHALAELFGTKFPEQWVGRTFRMFGVKKMGTDIQTGRPKSYWTFDIDMLVPPSEPSQLPAKQDISGWAAAAASGAAGPGLPGTRTPNQLPQRAAGSSAEAGRGVLTPIGEQTALQVMSTMHERGRTIEDLEKNLAAQGIDDLIKGKLPPAWPQAALPPIRKFVQMFPRSLPPMGVEAVARLMESWKPAPPPAEVINKTTGEVVNYGATVSLSREQMRGDNPFKLPPRDAEVTGYEPINEDDIPF
jgi:hypothetical protein